MYGEEEEGYDMRGDEDHEEGPCGKAMNSLVLLCVGIFLFPAALALLAYNERNYVKTSKEIVYASDNSEDTTCAAGADFSAGMSGVFFSCPVSEVDSHIWHPSSFNTVQGDKPLDVAVEFSGITVEQKVEVAQCHEQVIKHSKKPNQYVYTLEYVEGISLDLFSDAVEAVRARHLVCGPGAAKAACPLNLGGCKGSTVLAGESVQTGPFKMTEKLLKKRFIPDQIVDLSTFAGNFLNGTLYTGGPQGVIKPPILAGGVKMDTTNSRIVGSEIVTCDPAVAPALGCVKVSYWRSSATYATFIGAIDTDGRTSGMKVPASWLVAEDTYYDAWASTVALTKDELVAHLQDENEATLWMLRAVGLMLAWMSCFCCLQPIATAVDIMTDCIAMVPCVGDMIDAFIDGMVSTVICMVSCVCGLAWGLFVIALVWTAMRPMVGGCMLAGAIALCCCAAFVAKSSGKSPRRGGGKVGMCDHGVPDNEHCEECEEGA